MTITPARYDFKIRQNAPFNDVWTIKDGSGNAYDLTDWTAEMMFKVDADSEATATFSTDDSTIILGGATGTVTFNVSYTATLAIDSGYYVYDLRLVNDLSVPLVPIYGKVFVEKAVTV